MDHRLHATASMAESFYHLFVNRRAYTLQSTRPPLLLPAEGAGRGNRAKPGNRSATPGR